MEISDVELDCFYVKSDELNAEPTEESSRANFMKWFRQYAFSSPLERLILWGLPDEVHIPHSRGKFLDWMEDALIDIVTQVKKT